MASFNELDDTENIQEEEVPLAVVLDTPDDLDLGETDNMTEILDEETPLAKSGISGRIWWYWILIIISAVSGMFAKNKEKQFQNEAQSDEEE